MNWNNQAKKIWRELTGESKFKLGTSKAREIKDLALQIFHRWLCFNLAARNDVTGVVTLQELFLLWCMVRGRKVNFEFILGTQMKYTARHLTKNIGMCPIITRLGVKVSRIDHLVEGWKLLDKIEYLDKARLLRCGLVGEDDRGQLFLKEAERADGAEEA